jgi:hypothetical protein
MLKLILKAIQITSENSVSIKNARNDAAITCHDMQTADMADTTLLVVVLSFEENFGTNQVGHSAKKCGRFST